MRASADEVAFGPEADTYDPVPDEDFEGEFGVRSASRRKASASSRVVGSPRT